MDGWMGRWVGGCIGRWVDGYMGTNTWAHVLRDRYFDRTTDNEWKENIQANGLTDKQRCRWVCAHVCIHICCSAQAQRRCKYSDAHADTKSHVLLDAHKSCKAHFARGTYMLGV